MSAFVIFDTIDSLFNRLGEKEPIDKQRPGEPTDLDKTHLLELESLFGRALLERAIALVYGKQPIVLYQTPDGSASLAEVPGSKFATVYKVLPTINFCACESFRGWVLQQKRQPTCKHVLATKLALVLNRIQIESIPEDKLIILKKQLVEDSLKRRVSSGH